MLLAFGLIALFLLLFFAAPVTGPDFDHYLRWARAFGSADTIAFWDKGHILSPLGVPLTQWSHGPGLIIASLCPAGCRGLMSMDRQGMLTGMLFTAALWWAMFWLLRRAGAGDVQWAVYGAALAILGTHLGFYSRSYASETFSHATLALLAMWTVTRPQWRLTDALVVGCLAGLLVISRSQLLLYAVPFLGVMYWSAWKAEGTRRPAKPRTSLNTVLFVGSSLVPLGIALAEVGMTNRWMTGSLLGSPYAFGDGPFRSLDFARPEFSAVLLHPWHGLLTHHPLYALGFAALVVQIVRARSLPERLFWLGCAVVIVLHVYLQAAWYVWWLGMQTFGMRGLGASAVILVPALIRTMRERELRGQGYGGWAALALACCLWSAPLFLENLYAETQFLTYAELLGQYGTLLAPLVAPVALAGSITAIAFLIARAGGISDATGLRGRFADQVRRRPALSASLMLLIPLALYCLTEYVVSRETGEPAAQIASLAAALLGLGCTCLFLALSTQQPADDAAVPVARPLVETLVSVALVALLGVSALLFARLARHTEAMIAERTWPTEGIRYVSAAHVDEVAESYLEYLNVPGFDAKKAALKAYVEDLMACAAVTSPEETLPRVMGPPDVEAAFNTLFGTDLLLTGVGLTGGDGATYRAGDYLGVETRWQILNATKPQKFSLRLADAQGERRAAADYVPQVGCGDGDLWQPSADETDPGGIPIPTDLPPGSYTLRLVVYDPETLAPLPVGDAQDVALAAVEVTP